MKIYKYASFEKAKLILGQERVLLSPPTSFKDIYDSLLFITSSEKEKTIKLIDNYFAFKIISDFIKGCKYKLPFFQQRLINFVKWEMKIFDKATRLDKNYEPMLFMNFFSKVFRENIPDLKISYNEAVRVFNKEKFPEICSMRSKARISCFSKTYDNLHMWNEYCNGHNGICFEFEEDRPFFKEVEYSKKPFNLEIYKATSRILGFNYLNEMPTYRDKKLRDILLKPFFVKTDDYRCEDEIRCLLSDNEPNVEGYVAEKDGTYLKLKITRIFVGCRVPNSQELLDFLKLAQSKGIDISYMTPDPDYRKVVAVSYNI